jgi:hypothetical protein
MLVFTPGDKTVSRRSARTPTGPTNRPFDAAIGTYCDVDELKRSQSSSAGHVRTCTRSMLACPEHPQVREAGLPAGSSGPHFGPDMALAVRPGQCAAFRPSKL